MGILDRSWKSTGPKANDAKVVLGVPRVHSEPAASRTGGYIAINGRQPERRSESAAIRADVTRPSSFIRKMSGCVLEDGVAGAWDRTSMRVGVRNGRVWGRVVQRTETAEVDSACLKIVFRARVEDRGGFHWRHGACSVCGPVEGDQCEILRVELPNLFKGPAAQSGPLRAGGAAWAVVREIDRASAVMVLADPLYNLENVRCGCHDENSEQECFFADVVKAVQWL